MVLIFPQSLHSVVLGKTIKTCFKPSLAQLRLQDDILSAKSGDHNRWSDLASQAHTFRSTQMGGITGLQGQIKLLELEISRGRMGPADLANVFEKSKELSVRAYTLSCMLVSVPWTAAGTDYSRHGQQSAMRTTLLTNT